MWSGSPGSRVARETRLLLLTVLLSVVALLVLARLRFPERPAPPALVPPLLTQLGPSTPFDDLSSAVSALETQVAPLLLVLATAPLSPDASRAIPALRIRSDAAVALVPAADADRIAADVVARDRATGLAIIRTASSPPPERRTWTPQRGTYPRYLLVTEASSAGTSLRPVFVGTLQTTTSFPWETSVWIVPQHLRLATGAFVFTTTGALAGLVVDEPDSQAVVPAEPLIAAAERLMSAEQRPPGTLGVEVEELTQPVAAATGIASGVVVVHVDARGPAANQLFPTDVIEAMNDRTIVNPVDWYTRIARLDAAESVVLRVRRGGRSTEVGLTAVDISPPPRKTLGLAMRARPGLGAEVTSVDAGSIGDRAGLKAGDLITRVGGVASPGPTRVKDAFEALAPGGALLVAITRGSGHHVLALAKP